MGGDNENTNQISESRLEEIAQSLGCSVDEVQELSRQFKKSPEELPDLMGELKWSTDKIIKFGSAVAATYMAVKFQFVGAQKNALSGAFCLIVDGRNGKIIDEAYGATMGSLPSNSTSAWESFRQGILSFGGSPDRMDVPRLHKIAQTIFTASALRDIFSQQKGVQKQEAQSKLQKLIDGNYTGSTASQVIYEKFSASRLRLAGFDVELPETPENINQGQAPEEIKLEIKCRALVDPINGKACYELDKGDRIWVQLSNEAGMSGVVYRLFEYLQADPIFPVESMKELPTGSIELRFPITEEITGVANVLRDLKIKVFNPEAKAKKRGYLFSIIFAFAVGIAITLLIKYLF